MLLVVGSPVAPPRGHRPARRPRARRPTPTRSRRTPGRSSSGTACSGRSARRAPAATSCGSGTPRSSTPAARSSPSGGACSPTLAGPLAAAHAEIAPDEAAAGRLTLRYVTNAPPLPGESPRDALARRLAETAEKEVWNGSTLVGPHRDDLVFELDGRDLAGVRLARPAADGDPGPQAGRARPGDRPGRPPAAPAPRRRLLRARPGAAGAPRPADRGAAPGVRDDDDARRPRPGAARDRDGLGGARRAGGAELAAAADAADAASWP